MKFGNCEVDVPRKPAFDILVSEVLNPFYIFQVFSVLLWLIDSYYLYSYCILIISTGSIFISLFETIQNNENIRKLARYQCKVLIRMSDNVSKEISSTELVPGDVIMVPEATNLPCDLVLLSGSAIVNEAMLTGESIPVLKSSVPLAS